MPSTVGSDWYDVVLLVTENGIRIVWYDEHPSHRQLIRICVIDLVFREPEHFSALLEVILDMYDHLCCYHAWQQKGKKQLSSSSTSGGPNASIRNGVVVFASNDTEWLPTNNEQPLVAS